MGRLLKTIFTHKTKMVVLFIVIGLILPIGITIYGKLTFFEPLDKKAFKAQSIGASAEFTEKFSKKGCYELGLSSYERIFADRKKIDGKYRLQIYHDKELLQEKIIEENLAIGVYSHTDYSNTLLYVFEAPFKGHQKLTFKLTVLKSESIFNDDADDVYFYVNQSFYTCGEKMAKLEELKRIDTLTIDINETNETLIPLSKALWSSDTRSVKKIIPSQFRANIRMVADHTPLHYATYLNDVDTAEYLLENGADVNAVDAQGHTPLYYAIENNATKTVKLLLDKGADVKKVRFLSDSDRRIDVFVPEERPKGEPALFYAARNELYEITELLLESGRVDLDEKYSGWDAYRYYDSCIFQKYKEFSKLNKNGYYNVENPNAKKMFSLLERYGFKVEIENSEF